jgi:hypothetical protein
MPYYPEANILFIHIPKTGGTVIEIAISKQYEQTLIGGYLNNLFDFPYNMTSLQHQYYTTLYKYRNKTNIDFERAKVFTIVRNPYDRIISDLLWFGLIKKDYTADQVFSVIKDNYLYRNNLDNHNRPQSHFVTYENKKLIPSIKIFNSETLNEDNEKLNEYLGINIDIRQENVNKDYSRYLNKKSISLINDFYKLDFELFNYKMIHDI